MTNETLEFENDTLYRYTPMPQCGEGFYKKELVMTKETFVECHNRWIKGSEALNDSTRVSKEGN